LLFNHGMPPIRLLREIMFKDETKHDEACNTGILAVPSSGLPARSGRRAGKMPV
jgi:hypothetical protein